jgi:hypothetical protein
MFMSHVSFRAGAASDGGLARAASCAPLAIHSLTTPRLGVTTRAAFDPGKSRRWDRRPAAWQARRRSNIKAEAAKRIGGVVASLEGARAEEHRIATLGECASDGETDAAIGAGDKRCSLLHDVSVLSRAFGLDEAMPAVL